MMEGMLPIPFLVFVASHLICSNMGHHNILAVLFFVGVKCVLLVETSDAIRMRLGEVRVADFQSILTSDSESILKNRGRLGIGKSGKSVPSICLLVQQP